MAVKKNCLWLYFLSSLFAVSTFARPNLDNYLSTEYWDGESDPWLDIANSPIGYLAVYEYFSSIFTRAATSEHLQHNAVLKTLRQVQTDFVVKGGVAQGDLKDRSYLIRDFLDAHTSFFFESAPPFEAVLEAHELTNEVTGPSFFLEALKQPHYTNAQKLQILQILSKCFYRNPHWIHGPNKTEYIEELSSLGYWSFFRKNFYSWAKAAALDPAQAAYEILIQDQSTEKDHDFGFQALLVSVLFLEKKAQNEAALPFLTKIEKLERHQESITDLKKAVREAYLLREKLHNHALPLAKRIDAAIGLYEFKLLTDSEIQLLVALASKELEGLLRASLLKTKYPEQYAITCRRYGIRKSVEILLEHLPGNPVIENLALTLYQHELLMLPQDYLKKHGIQNQALRTEIEATAKNDKSFAATKEAIEYLSELKEYESKKQQRVQISGALSHEIVQVYAGNIGSAITDPLFRAISEPESILHPLLRRTYFERILEAVKALQKAGVADIPGLYPFLAKTRKVIPALGFATDEAIWRSQFPRNTLKLDCATKAALDEKKD